ncbi:MAG: hypothetical protein IME96_01725 [Proteobacteria bacterium]|nr:hypothetical protein [Pseudomonadota bacterium]
MKSYITINTSLEQLKYRESEPDNKLTSTANVRNYVAGLEGIKVWDTLFIGVRGFFPIGKGRDTEKWTQAGIQNQTNDLEYGWTRVDGFIGLVEKSWLKLYGGLRWSEGKQKRNNFVVSGIPQQASSTEIIRSRSALIGMRGEGKVSSRWSLLYRMEGFIPLAVEVTNGAVPGFEATRKKGYSYELEGGINYYYSNSIMLGLSGFGGRMHWEGSDWQAYGNKSVKWPENDTDYLGGSLKLDFAF